jgi:hypothetical protein
MIRRELRNGGQKADEKDLVSGENNVVPRIGFENSNMPALGKW